MKMLLDTHLLLWAAGQPDRLSPEARKFIDNPANELLFSAASLWEVVIKRGLGRDDFKVDARVLRRGLLDNGYCELPVVSAHVVAIDKLTCNSQRSIRSRSDSPGNRRRHSTSHHRFCGGEVSWSNSDGVSAIVGTRRNDKTPALVAEDPEILRGTPVMRRDTVENEKTFSATSFSRNRSRSPRMLPFGPEGHRVLHSSLMMR